MNVVVRALSSLAAPRVVARDNTRRCRRRPGGHRGSFRYQTGCHGGVPVLLPGCAIAKPGGRTGPPSWPDPYTDSKMY